MRAYVLKFSPNNACAIGVLVSDREGLYPISESGHCPSRFGTLAGMRHATKLGCIQYFVEFTTTDELNIEVIRM